MSEPKVELTTGDPVPADASHTKLKPNGQQEGYVVLSPEERAKGFVRPVRRTYIHVGPKKPVTKLRELTDEERERFSRFGYVAYEEYPESDSAVCGKYWKQEDINRMKAGCGAATTMSQSLAETYARDPHFYSGTFCVACGKHYPVVEFVWDGTDEPVGS